MLNLMATTGRIQSGKVEVVAGYHWNQHDILVEKDHTDDATEEFESQLLLELAGL